MPGSKYDNYQPHYLIKKIWARLLSWEDFGSSTILFTVCFSIFTAYGEDPKSTPKIVVSFLKCLWIFFKMGQFPPINHPNSKCYLSLLHGYIETNPMKMPPCLNSWTRCLQTQRPQMCKSARSPTAYWLLELTHSAPSMSRVWPGVLGISWVEGNLKDNDKVMVRLTKQLT